VLQKWFMNNSDQGYRLAIALEVAATLPRLESSACFRRQRAATGATPTRPNQSKLISVGPQRDHMLGDPLSFASQSRFDNRHVRSCTVTMENSRRHRTGKGRRSVNHGGNVSLGRHEYHCTVCAQRDGRRSSRTGSARARTAPTPGVPLSNQLPFCLSNTLSCPFPDGPIKPSR